MLGFYQLAFSRVSQHAAVSETVDACKSLNSIGMKGLVNAILRSFIRQELHKNIPDDQQLASGLPKWLYKRLSDAYPNELSNLVTSMQVKAPIRLRVNKLQISREKYAAELESLNIEFTLGVEQKNGIILAKGRDITTLPGFHQGCLPCKMVLPS